MDRLILIADKGFFHLYRFSQQATRAATQGRTWEGDRRSTLASCRDAVSPEVRATVCSSFICCSGAASGVALTRWSLTWSSELPAWPEADMPCVNSQPCRRLSISDYTRSELLLAAANVAQVQTQRVMPGLFRSETTRMSASEGS